jgi:hypothetical protein
LWTESQIIAAATRNPRQYSPPYSPELNPQEIVWGEIHEKIFRNYALKSMSNVHVKFDEAAL